MTRSEIADPIFMLVEAKFGSAAEHPPRERFMGFSDYTNNVFVEEFGEPVAWRVDSHFAFLLRTDNERLLQFILASFMAENYSINNDLQLIRIQSEWIPDMYSQRINRIPPFSCGRGRRGPALRVHPATHEERRVRDRTEGS